MISLAYYKIQEILLCAMIISLPLMRIPDRYTLFSMGNNLSMGFLFFFFFFFFFNTPNIVQKTIQTTDIIKYSLNGTSVFFFNMLYTINKKMEKNKNTIEGNEFVLQVKLMVSLVWYLFRNFIFPLIGLFLIIFNLYMGQRMY